MIAINHRLVNPCSGYAIIKDYNRLPLQSQFACRLASLSVILSSRAVFLQQLLPVADQLEWNVCRLQLQLYKNNTEEWSRDHTQLCIM